MVRDDVQDLVERALKAKLAEAGRYLRDGAPDPEAERLIAALVDALNGCSATLNTAFQALVDAGRYAEASRIKQEMDTIALVVVGLERKVVALYEAGSAAAAAALDPVLAKLKAAGGEASDDADTADHIAQAVSALTTAIGLATA